MTDINETALIIKVHGASEEFTDDARRPIVLRIQTDTLKGQLVLWISGAAARELEANLTHILRGKSYQ